MVQCTSNRRVGGLSICRVKIFTVAGVFCLVKGINPSLAYYVILKELRLWPVCIIALLLVTGPYSVTVSSVPAGEGWGEDVLDLVVPGHAPHVVQRLRLGTRGHWGGPRLRRESVKRLSILMIHKNWSFRTPKPKEIFFRRFPADSPLKNRGRCRK